MDFFIKHNWTVDSDEFKFTLGKKLFKLNHPSLVKIMIMREKALIIEWNFYNLNSPGERFAADLNNCIFIS
jgi:hypothetical protein